MKTQLLLVIALLAAGVANAESATAKAPDGTPLVVAKRLESAGRTPSATVVPLSGRTVAQLKYSNGFSGVGSQDMKLSGKSLVQMKLDLLRQ